MMYTQTIFPYIPFFSLSFFLFTSIHIRVLHRSSSLHNYHHKWTNKQRSLFLFLSFSLQSCSNTTHTHKHLHNTARQSSFSIFKQCGSFHVRSAYDHVEFIDGLNSLDAYIDRSAVPFSRRSTNLSCYRKHWNICRPSRGTRTAIWHLAMAVIHVHS